VDASGGHGAILAQPVFVAWSQDPATPKNFVLLAIFGMSRRGHRQTSFDVVLPTPIIRLRKRGYA